ncbi:hypothetical protein ABPG72_020829, partial [Tetrahymena utriculariae]
TNLNALGFIVLKLYNQSILYGQWIQQKDIKELYHGKAKLTKLEDKIFKKFNLLQSFEICLYPNYQQRKSVAELTQFLISKKQIKPYFVVYSTILPNLVKEQAKIISQQNQKRQPYESPPLTQNEFIELFEQLFNNKSFEIINSGRNEIVLATKNEKRIQGIVFKQYIVEEKTYIQSEEKKIKKIQIPLIVEFQDHYFIKGQNNKIYVFYEYERSSRFLKEYALRQKIDAEISGDNKFLICNKIIGFVSYMNNFCVDLTLIKDNQITVKPCDFGLFIQLNDSQQFITENNQIVNNEKQIYELLNKEGGKKHFIKLIEHVPLLENWDAFIFQKQRSLKQLYTEYEKKKIFPELNILTFVFDLLNGLIDLRRASVIHLDIKKENILIDEQGNLIYCDFGISELKKQNQRIRSRGCTEGYSPNEQIHVDSDNQIDFETDIYSLGKTLRELVDLFIKNNPQSKLIKFAEELLKIVKDQMIQEDIKDRSSCYKIYSQVSQLFEVIPQDFISQHKKRIKELKIEIQYYYDLCVDYYFEDIYQNLDQIKDEIKKSVNFKGYKNFQNDQNKSKIIENLYDIKKQIQRERLQNVNILKLSQNQIINKQCKNKSY